MFLIKVGPKKQFILTFKLVENNLHITVMPTDDTKRFFKSQLNEQCLNGQLGAYFESMKEIFDYFKQQSSQTIDFKPDVQVEGKQSQKKHILTYYISVGAKKKQKTLEFNEQTTQALINTTKAQVSQLQKIENTKANIQKKKKKMKQMKEQIKKLTDANTSKDQQMEKSKRDNEQMKQQIVNKLAQIENMRNQYKDKNAHKYQNMKDTVLNMAGNLQSDSQSSQLKSEASVIYEAMPDSYELCPLGKHVQTHNGKRNLFLKQKQVTDDQIQSMIGFDWSEIQVLSLGANKITNKGINLLSEISDFSNVIELYLFANPITNITKIKFLPQLKKISFYELSLDEASCDHILKLKFPKLNEIYLDFDYKIRQKCWKKIVDSGLKNFPALQSLHVDHPDAISDDTKNNLQAICLSINIACNFGNPNAGLQNCVIY